MKYVIVSSQHQDKIDVEPESNISKTKQNTLFESAPCNDHINTIQLNQENNNKDESHRKEKELKGHSDSNEYSRLQAALRNDEDTNYLLSLTGYFRRMPTRKKIIAKLKILEYLTELEISDENYDSTDVLN